MRAAPSNTGRLAASAVFCALLALSGPASADTRPSDPPADTEKPAATFLTPLTDELDVMGVRLRRGASNTGLGWLEIPNGIQEIGSKHGVGAAATWGLIHGTGRAVQRTAVGLFELVTFPFKLTEDNRPMIEPESVLDRPASEGSAGT